MQRGFFFFLFENRTLNCKAGTAFLSSTATHLSGAPAFPPLCADWPPRRVDGENRNHLTETSGRACKTDALVFGGAKRRECTGAAVKLSVEIFCTKRSHVSIVRRQALSVWLGLHVRKKKKKKVEEKISRTILRFVLGTDLWWESWRKISV